MKLIRRYIYNFEQTNGYYVRVFNIIKKCKETLTCSKSADKIPFKTNSFYLLIMFKLLVILSINKQKQLQPVD